MVTVEEVTVAPAPVPLASLSAAALMKRLATDPTSIGSASLGRPNRGSLLNGVQLASGLNFDVLNPKHSWATADTADVLARSMDVVRRRFPDAPRLVIGDISREHGGYFRPHASHQSGLDVDLGYFYTDGSRWYTRANADNLDVALTWALLEALVSEGDIQYVFMDREVQRLISDYAQAQGADSRWLDSLFDCRGNRQALIRHRWGHATHLHVRFFDTTATRLGARISRLGRRSIRLARHRTR